MFIDEDSKPSDKLKAWYLFTEDFIAGTQHLTPIEIGCYVRLLCWNWNKRCKGIPDNADVINRICVAITKEEQEAAGEIINQFFNLIIDKENPDNNKWQNTRQLKEWLYINNRIEVARQNGSKGGRPKKNQTDNPTNNQTKTPLTNTPTPNNDIDNMLTFEKDIWNKINLKRGSKKRAYITWSRLNNKIDSSLIVNNYNKLISNTDDTKFVPHLSSWLSAERWEEDLTTTKKEEDNFGIIPRDPFRNLSFWQKGRKMPQDYDRDIEIMHKKGKITDEAMKKMGFSI
jgi:uncharacterized protein YdaU (DUF1376 family)